MYNIYTTYQSAGPAAAGLGPGRAGKEPNYAVLYEKWVGLPGGAPAADWRPALGLPAAQPLDSKLEPKWLHRNITNYNK